MFSPRSLCLALGLTAVVIPPIMAANSTNGNSTLPRRIDVHSHFLPPDYSQALRDNGYTHPDGMPAIPDWSLDEHLHMMANASVSKSILSVSSPGTVLIPGNDSFSQSLTRLTNAYAAKLKKQRPDKFGYWASLPFPNVNNSLAEIDKALEEGADGFALLTNYFGVYLGDTSLEPIFARLNELGATVFIHPTTPCIHQPNTSATQVTKALPFGTDYPVPMFEFFFDTARAVINLFLKGTVGKNPNIKFIIPHVGGALPPLWDRFVTFSSIIPGGTVLNATQARATLAEQFYFDLAGFAFDGDVGGLGQIKALVEGFQISYERLLYGSDFPFTNTAAVTALANRMKNGLENLFTEEQRDRIYAGNAEELLKGSKAKKRNAEVQDAANAFAG